MKWKFRFGVVAGNALEYYDIAVFAAISTYLSIELTKLGYSQATEMVWGIFALRFLIRPLGGYVIGRYADTVGKKSALVLTSLITGTATLMMALLPIELLGNYTPLVILILQLALSFSFAGEFPSLITYLFKDLDGNIRSRVSSIIVGSSLCGVIASLAIVFMLKNTLSEDTMQSIGWRIPLLIGLINILISFWFRAKLPDYKNESNREIMFSWYRIFLVFLFTIPGTVTFYSQSLSTSLIIQQLKIDEIKNYYEIFSSGLLLVFMMICGWLTDKYGSAKFVFDIGVIGMVLFSAPLYFLLQIDNLLLVFFAQVVMSAYSAMILCNLSAVLMDKSDGQATILGIGYNSAAASIGGITPLIVSYLSHFNLGYVGLFIAVCGLSYFISAWLPKPKLT
ncbi:TPA: MFS transporter [Providencia rettgeri]|uniref:MFS transporter n=1 Tax=Providencia TaxID=586 RepID=UPI001B9EB623|nr:MULTISPECIES: MFS transporter [Providencia]EMB5785698.1 MFS transporter [Providencia rettgeri]EMB5788727.1 MFS transporter [Providencia rettgeri]MDK7744118.1 MFS transporter [Providencia rettgeri]MDK7756841.1 MFS transporter [Providencia rettgeri]HBC7430729.1 MFS transporter [Providencia rettgeri]